MSVTFGTSSPFKYLTNASTVPTAIWRGNSPYALMWVSMVALVYLGLAGVMSLLRIYEAAPVAVWAVQCVEAVLLLLINCQLFILLKRLPAMHKQNAQS